MAYFSLYSPRVKTSMGMNCEVVAMMKALVTTASLDTTERTSYHIPTKE